MAPDADGSGRALTQVMALQFADRVATGDRADERRGDDGCFDAVMNPSEHATLVLAVRRRRMEVGVQGGLIVGGVLLLVSTIVAVVGGLVWALSQVPGLTPIN